MFHPSPPKDPLELFAEWYAKAETDEPRDPNAVALATVGEEGMPSLRMVLLKGYDERGFVFYTNLGSRKSRELAAQPKAALLFYWKTQGRQVRIEGPVEAVSEAEADAYYASRPRDSRIGAWASKQSEPLDGRFELEKRLARYALKFAVGEIPRPPFWSGFRVVQQRMEFWAEGAFRLHHRLVYDRVESGWRQQWLYP